MKSYKRTIDKVVVNPAIRLKEVIELPIIKAYKSSCLRQFNKTKTISNVKVNDRKTPYFYQT